MEIAYSKTFLKDLTKVFPSKTKEKIEKFVFEELPGFTSIEKAGNIEQLTGYKDYYKIRFGDFRVGLLKKDNTIKLLRVMNRKEIYKYFP